MRRPLPHDGVARVAMFRFVVAPALGASLAKEPMPQLVLQNAVSGHEAAGAARPTAIVQQDVSIGGEQRARARNHELVAGIDGQRREGQVAVSVAGGIDLDVPVKEDVQLGLIIAIARPLLQSEYQKRQVGSSVCTWFHRALPIISRFLRRSVSPGQRQGCS